MSNIIRSQSNNIPIRSVQETQAKYLLLDPTVSEIETEIVVSTPRTGFFGLIHYSIEERVTIRTRKCVARKDSEWWR